MCKKFRILIFLLSYLIFSCVSSDKLEILQFNYQPVNFGLFETKVEIINEMGYLYNDDNVEISEKQNIKLSECLTLSKKKNNNFIRINLLSIKDNNISSININHRTCYFFINYDIVEFTSDSRHPFYRRYPKKPKENYSGYFNIEYSLMKAVKSPVQMNFKEYINYQLIILNEGIKKYDITITLDTGKILYYQLVI